MPMYDTVDIPSEMTHKRISMASFTHAFLQANYMVTVIVMLVDSANIVIDIEFIDRYNLLLLLFAIHDCPLRYPCVLVHL